MSAPGADMLCGRPPRCRASQSGDDSKLGLTMVRPSLQLAPEPPALDPPPVSKHVCPICGNFLRFLTSADIDCSTERCSGLCSTVWTS